MTSACIGSTSPQLSRAGNKTETEYVKRNKAEKSKSLINDSTRLTQLSPHVTKPEKVWKFRDFKNYKTSHHRINTTKTKTQFNPSKMYRFLNHYINSLLLLFMLVAP